ncbi:hypothetical protein DFH09DRAFT_1319174 [Mycena vulgaris]|nr:hypothetical protein DFH09DRAFT_1319174 [Mycena vulgaris]
MTAFGSRRAATPPPIGARRVRSSGPCTEGFHRIPSCLDYWGSSARLLPLIGPSLSK